MDPAKFYEMMGICAIAQTNKPQLNPIADKALTKNRPFSQTQNQQLVLQKAGRKIKPPLPGNLFYIDSRFHHRPPPLPALPHCTCRVNCRRAVAVIKCYSCVKFDTQSLGLYCQSCFEARHPWYRAEHTFLPLNQTEQADVDHQRITFWVEADRKVAVMADLLKKTKKWLDDLEADGQDYKADDMLKESGKKLVKAEERIRALMDRLRGSDSDAMVLKEADEMPDEIETLLRSQSNQSQMNISLDLARLKRPSLSDDEAALRIQCQFRRYQALCIALVEVQEVYCIKYEKSLGVWYYFNSLTKRTSWKRPPFINRKREYLLYTPRTHKRNFGDRHAKLLALVPIKPEHIAARKVQALARKWKARHRLHRKIAMTYLKIYDENQEMYYYFNKKTSQSSWEKPKLFGDFDIEATDPSAVESIPEIWKMMQNKRKKKRSITRDKAVAVLQGFFKTCLARKRVFQMFSEQYRKIYDRPSDNCYYYCIKTGKSSWVKPLLLGGYDIETVTI